MPPSRATTRTRPNVKLPQSRAQGLRRCEIDGIIQFSTGGGQFARPEREGPVHGCIVLAEAAHRLAEKYDILIGLHTDHCQPEAAEVSSNR